MKNLWRLTALIAAVCLTACTTTVLTRPNAWAAPEVLVAPSSFHGVHGLAIDAKGRLLAGTVVGSSMWEVDRTTGATKVFIAAPEGEADDIAIGPKGEWHGLRICRELCDTAKTTLRRYVFWPKIYRVSTP